MARIWATTILVLVSGMATAGEPRSLDDKIADSIRAVAGRGAELFNAGDAASCCRLFEGALLALKPMLDHRPEEQKGLTDDLVAAGSITDASKRAYRLREGLVRTFRAVAPMKKLAPDGKDLFQLSKEEQEILDLTNAERKAAGLGPLTADPKLFRAAREHSANMARQDRLAHSLDGQEPGDRIRTAGYTAAGWAENCAAGQRTPADVLDSWMRSPGHRANILGAHSQIGIGVGVTADGKKYYTQVFANPQR